MRTKHQIETTTTRTHPAILLGTTATVASMLAVLLMLALGGLPAWATSPSAPDWEVEGSGATENFGYVVAGLGDYTGDGYADVVVTAPGFAISPTVAPGAFFIFPGSEDGLLATPLYTITGPAEQAVRFGLALDAVTAPQVANRRHIVVGAPGLEQAIWFAPLSEADPTPTAYFTATQVLESARFGEAVAVVGDLTGSSYSDFVVGAPGDTTEIGQVAVFQGGNLTATLAITLTGGAIDDDFGFSLGGGLLRRDSPYASLVVGAPKDNQNGSAAGRVYLYHGGASGPASTPDQKLADSEGQDQFGNSLAVVGDVNGDGIEDLLVGADRAGETGRAYLYLGGTNGVLATPFDTLMGEAPEDRFGFAVAPGGDLNNDGFADVIVTARDHNDEVGRVYVFAGCVDGFLPEPIMIFDGEDTLLASRYGRSVASIGQADNDPLNGVLVGALGFPRPPLIGAGKAYGYYAPNDLPTCRASIVMTGTVALAEEGQPLTCGEGGTLEVDEGDTVAYCYQIRNTGPITLTRHTIGDETGDLIDGQTTPISLTLAPGASHTEIVTATATITDNGPISLTWRAAAPIVTPNSEDNGVVETQEEIADTASAAVQLTVRQADPDPTDPDPIDPTDPDPTDPTDPDPTDPTDPDPTDPTDPDPTDPDPTDPDPTDPDSPDPDGHVFIPLTTYNP